MTAGPSQVPGDRTTPDLVREEGTARPLAWTRTVLAALASATAWLVLYYTLPIVPGEGDRVWWQLLIAAAVFVVVLVHQVRAIARHPRPLHRSVVSIAVLLPLFVVMYAWVYLTLSVADPSSFDGTMSRTTSLYYTVTVATSVGFGDITPKTDTARIATMVQMVADVTIVVVGVRLLVHVGKEASHRRNAPSPERVEGSDPT